MWLIMISSELLPGLSSLQIKNISQLEGFKKNFMLCKIKNHLENTTLDFA